MFVKKEFPLQDLDSFTSILSKGPQKPTWPFLAVLTKQDLHWSLYNLN